MSVSASIVKELREKTNAGMMDCKKALQETNGDLQKAVDVLRKKGKASAAKKIGRATKEGIIETYIHMGGKLGVMVEINCESDFVVRNEIFRVFTKDVAMHIAAAKPSYVSVDEVPEDERPFKRYKITEDGISPRTIPGVIGGQHDAGSDEHDEWGNLVSDRRSGYPEAIEVRKQQMKKRMTKMDTLLAELPAPEVAGYTSEEAKLLVVGWGSTKDTIAEARMMAEKDGIKTAQLHIKYILPFHGKEVGEILRSYESKGVKILMVEGNYTGQMARYIRGETSFEFKEKYLRYEGENILQGGV